MKKINEKRNCEWQYAAQTPKNWALVLDMFSKKIQHVGHPDFIKKNRSEKNKCVTNKKNPMWCDQKCNMHKIQEKYGKFLTTASMRKHYCVVTSQTGVGSCAKPLATATTKSSPKKREKKTNKTTKKQGEPDKTDIWNPIRTETLKCMPASFFEFLTKTNTWVKYFVIDYYFGIVFRWAQKSLYHKKNVCDTAFLRSKYGKLSPTHVQEWLQLGPCWLHIPGVFVRSTPQKENVS